MRKWLSSLILLVPMVAAGQTLGGIRGSDTATAVGPVTTHGSLQSDTRQGGVVVPLWRDADGRMLALVGTGSHNGAKHGDDGLDFRVVDVSQGFTSGLRYDIGPHVDAYAQLAQRNWLVPGQSAVCVPSDSIGCPNTNTLQAARLISSEFGASYRGSGYRVDVALGTTRPHGASTLLPRVLPRAATASGVPLWSLSHSTNLSAHGRLALGSHTGIDVGASVGRIRLLPGNLLGVNELGQQSLSFGVDSGALSGRITGRMMQPEGYAGTADSLGSSERRWTTIDLGVTWRLPWQGELRFGAQNIWSSGQTLKPVDGPQPDQSRIPYVQYHQDL